MPRSQFVRRVLIRIIGQDSSCSVSSKHRVSKGESTMTEETTPAADPNPDPAAKPDGGFLHVIFHGLFCFFEEPGYIRVRVPRVDPMPAMGCMPAMKGHSYLVGSWLGERSFAPGNGYRLQGVDSGSAHFDPVSNLIIKGASASQNPGHHLYAEMRFP